MANETAYNPCKYTGNGSTVEFSFSWKIFTETDITVTLEKIATGEQATLVYGTDYNVNYSEVGGYVTLTSSPSSNYYVIITRDVSDYQSKRYSTSTGFQGSEIENSFDNVSCNIQEIEYTMQRAIKVPVGSSILDLTLPLPDPGKTLKWNQTGTGLVNSSLDIDTLEYVANRIYQSVDNVDAVANDLTNIDAVNANKTNIDTVAASISNVNAVGGSITKVNAVYADLTNVDAVAEALNNIDAVKDNASNINTVAGSISNVNAVANDLTNINAVNSNKTNIDTVAGIKDDITTLVANETVIQTLYEDRSAFIWAYTHSYAIDTIADNSLDILNVAGYISNINAVADDLTNINAVNANKTNIDTVAGSISNINEVGSGILKVNAVADDLTNINAVNSNKTNIDAVAGSINNVNAVADDLTNINAVNANKANIDTVAGISSDVTTVAGIAGDVTAVKNNAANITAVAGSIANINTVAGMSSDITAVKNNASNINTVAGSISNVNAVGGSISNVNAVAGSLSNIAAAVADLANIDAASTNAQLAKNWATKMNGTVDGSDYSAKYYAQQAAQGQVQANWNEVDTTAKSYIQNKPTIPTVPTNVSAFTNDAGYLTSHQDISGKQDKIDSSHKLDADLVDDTSSTNKFVTASDISNWNGKGTYSKPSGGIPDTDLSSGVQASLGLADTSLQNIGVATNNNLWIGKRNCGSGTFSNTIAIGMNVGIQGICSNSILLGASSQDVCYLDLTDTFQVNSYKLLDLSTGLIPDARISDVIARTAPNITTLSGTSITLVDNSINTLTPSGNTTFTLPTVTDTTIFHQILVQLNLSTVYTINLGTTNYFNCEAPDLSNTGKYNLIYEYNNALSAWVVGCIEEGAAE